MATHNYNLCLHTVTSLTWWHPWLAHARSACHVTVVWFSDQIRETTTLQWISSSNYRFLWTLPPSLSLTLSFLPWLSMPLPLSPPSLSLHPSISPFLSLHFLSPSSHPNSPHCFPSPFSLFVPFSLLPSLSPPLPPPPLPPSPVLLRHENSLFNALQHLLLLCHHPVSLYMDSIAFFTEGKNVTWCGY